MKKDSSQAPEQNDWREFSRFRFVAVREELQTSKLAVGRKLIDLPS